MPDDATHNTDVNSASHVEQLAEEYLERLRNGERPRISEYANAHPELADDIRTVFRTLAMLEDLAPDHNDDEDFGGPSPGDAPSHLGEYQILRELGRGGMGVVYEAEHATMRRRVALKVLHRRSSNRGHNLERFLREARAAGRLHHTNIVPVFEVGESDGTHYYAMQCIRGQNLDLVLADLKRIQEGSSSLLLPDEPNEARSAAQCLISGVYESTIVRKDDAAHWDKTTETNVAKSSTESLSKIIVPDDSELSNVAGEKAGYFRRVATIGLQVADALAYAHDHGILHRDIKPSNLILDTEGTVWVTDFGLARTEGEDLTHTGDIVGTLRYMAPERFRGTADARSDIYSVGLTLYELCTLRYAFDRTDRAELIRQVTHQDPTPPRRVNPSIPRDLETIVLKCIDREPTARYTSADALANDLRLFLADRPILARRTSWPEQTWRWCRRNPLVASMLSCIALLLAVVSVGALAFAISISEHSRELEAETTRARKAERIARDSDLESRRSLYEAYIANSQASRWSGRPGRRHTSLKAIRNAVGLLPNLEFDAEVVARDTLALRNAAIAAMPLVDVCEARTFENPQGAARGSAISPDGKMMSLVDGTDAIVIDTDSGEQIFSRNYERVYMTMFDPTGRYLYFQAKTDDDGPSYVTIWDLQTEELVVETLWWGMPSFHPSKPLIATQGKKNINLISLESGELQRTFETGPARVHFMTYSPDGKLGIVQGKKLTILDEDGQSVEELEFPGVIRSVAMSGNGSLAVGCRDRNVHVRTPGSDVIRKYDGHTGEIVLTNFSRDGRLIVSEAWGGTRFIRDTYTGERLVTLAGIHISEGGFVADDRYLGFVEPSRRKGLLEVSSGGPFRMLHSLETKYWGVAPHPIHYSLVAISSDNGVEIWDVDRERLVQRMKLSRAAEVHFSPDGRTLFATDSAGRRSVMASFDVSIDKNGPVTASIGEWQPIPGLEASQPPGLVQHLSISADGQTIAVLNRNAEAVVVNRDSDEPPKVLGPHPHATRVSVSPDGSLVASGAWHGRGVRVWDVSTGKLIKELVPNDGSAYVGFSPDGQWLVASTQQREGSGTQQPGPNATSPAD